MADKKKRPSRLGRGLSSLMATPTELPAVPVGQGETLEPRSGQAPDSAGDVGQDGHHAAQPGRAATKDEGSGNALTGLISVSVDRIVPNRHQPRQTFSDQALAGLAKSIRQDGLMQPVVLRPAEQGGYELIAGERRWRAAKLTGLATIPAIVHAIDDEQSAQWALVENLQREDLNPMDKAEAFKRLADGFGLPHAEIAQRVGLERSTVTNLMRLLALSAPCRDLVREGLLSMGQARAIAGLPSPAQQDAVARKAVRDGLSVRQVEQEARRLLQTGNAPAATTPTGPSKNNLVDLERQIGEQLGTRVRVKSGRKKGSGTLSIDFFSLEEFDALLARMKIETS